MKLGIKLFIAVFSMTISIVNAQSVKEEWANIINQEGVAQYFSGMWEKLGVHIVETDESITVIHKGDHFDLVDGINDGDVDYKVDIHLDNLKNMAEHGKDGKIDENESFRIMAVLFTPFVRATLQHPMMNKSFQMKLAGIENLVHVYLKGPQEGDVVTHTMIFINKHWVVCEGIHGAAKRVFEIDMDHAIEYQREAYKAQKTDTRKGWKAYKKFYLNWRKEVSRPIKS